MAVELMVFLWLIYTLQRSERSRAERSGVGMMQQRTYIRKVHLRED